MMQASLQRRAIAVCAAVLAAGFAASRDEASSRTWSATGNGENIVITDCRDCGDDIGMMVACQGAGRPAQVTVHWAATPEGEAGATRPIELDVDGEFFDYQATAVEFGQIGFTPQFDLSPDDPLIEALQAGFSLIVGFGGGEVEIGLTGSRAAFEVFNAHCPWRVAAGQESETEPEEQPESEPSEDAQSEDDASMEAEPAASEEVTAIWAFYRDEQSRGTLIFGEPETDNTALAAVCAQGSGLASVEFFAGPQIAGAGIPVQVVVTTPTGSRNLAALANAQGRPVATVGAGDLLWAVLSEPGPVTISVGGQPAGTLDSVAGNAQAGEFFTHCGLQ